MTRDEKREEEQIRIDGELAESEAARELLQAEVFQAWMDEQIEDARDRCVRVVRTHASNYEKAMAAGILRYWEAKRKDMERKASPEYRQKRLKRLEELNAERNESTGPAGFIKAGFGQF